MATLTRKSLGKLIAYAREKQNKTPYKVSQDTGVRIESIQGIESAETDATLGTVLPLLKSLGIKVEITYNQKKLKV